MKTVYAKDESVIKEWELFKDKGSAQGKKVSTLTVTNKRLIYIENAKLGSSRKEERLDCIRDIRGGVDHGKWRWWMVLLGILTFIIIVGIVLLFREYKRARKGHFYIIIRTTPYLGRDSEYTYFGMNAGSVQNSDGLANKIKSKLQDENELQIEFDPNVITEVLETLGAIILDNQQQPPAWAVR